MGNIRYETAFASMVFVEELRYSGRFGKMLHNGTDIVLFETNTGEHVSVHYIDSALPLYEIRKTLESNQQKGIFTLFMLWSEMMLPSAGQRYRADDWMEALYTLYRDTIYGYDVIEGEVYLFPVYFRGSGQVREIEYGARMDFGQLTCRTVTTHFPGLNATWQVADFGGERGYAHDPKTEVAVVSALADDYALIGVAVGADSRAVKIAYRQRARQLHPDVNPSADAHDQMQRLNVAYARILASLGD